MSCVRGYIPSTILLACGFLSFALCSPAQAQDEWTQEDQSSSGGERSPRGIVLSDRHPVGAGETGVCVQQSGRVAKFLSGLFGTPTEQKEKEFALEAARDAHALGYNWVILSPLEATTGKRSFSSQQWVVVGTSYGIGTITDYIAPQWVTKSFTVRGYVMDCMALDDIAAYHLLFGDAEGVEATNPYKVYSVYDVDEALGPMVEGSGHRPLRRNPPFISSRRLQQPGQKERLAAQLAVMQDTERCMRAHVDAGAGSAAAVQQSADMEGMIECWTNLAPAAAQAGWDSFPLFTAMRKVESEEAGYTRRSDMAGAEAPADKGFQWLEPKAAGGYRWSEERCASPPVRNFPTATLPMWLRTSRSLPTRCSTRSCFTHRRTS